MNTDGRGKVDQRVDEAIHESTEQILCENPFLEDFKVASPEEREGLDDNEWKVQYELATKVTDQFIFELGRNLHLYLKQSGYTCNLVVEMHQSNTVRYAVYTTGTRTKTIPNNGNGWDDTGFAYSYSDGSF